MNRETSRGLGLMAVAALLLLVGWVAATAGTPALALGVINLLILVVAAAGLSLVSWGLLRR